MAAGSAKSTLQELWLVVSFSAAFIASVCSSGFGDRDSQYLVLAITLFNSQVIIRYI